MFLVYIAAAIAAVAAQQCSFSKDTLQASWQVVNNELAISFANTDLGNNQWTGIGFGDKMTNLEVIIFKIENNQPSVSTGYTTGYAPPILDANSYVTLQSVQYNSNQLHARVVVPFGNAGPRNFAFNQCGKWNVLAGGDVDESGELGIHYRPPFGAVQTCSKKCKN